MSPVSPPWIDWRIDILQNVVENLDVEPCWDGVPEYFCPLSQQT